MMPMPAPAPPMPMQAMPAPMYFAATGSMKRTPLRGLVERAGSVARMDSIVEIDAGEDREDVGLKERNHQLEAGQGDREAERQQRADLADEAERAEHGHEAREHFQRDVAGQHVGEQTDAVRDRAGEEGDDFDHDHQRQDHRGDAGGDEQLKELQAVLVE